MPDAWKINDCHSFIVLFPGLTQECLDLSFWFKHETTPLNNEQVHGVTALSEHQLFNTEIYRRYRFMYYAIESQRTCAYCASLRYHAHMAWLHARFNQSCSIVSLTELVANQVASVVCCPWRQPMVGTDESVGWVHTVSGVSQEPQEPRMGYGYGSRDSVQTSLTLSEQHLLELPSWSSGSCKTRGASHIFTVFQCCLSCAEVVF